jgi:phosphoglycolate phosphatase
MTRGVLLDLDGTLIDSASDIRAALNRTLAHFGAPVASLAEVRGWIGDGAMALLLRALEDRGLTLSAVEMEAWFSFFRDRYAEHAAVETTIYPGVVAALAQWREAGVRVAVVTNKPERPARLALQALGLAASVDAVVGGDTLPYRKPHPAPLREAMARAGITRAVLVGDGLADRDAARAAAMPFLWCAWGYGRPEVAKGAAGTILRSEELGPDVTAALATL